jgi:hypothetical protein
VKENDIPQFSLSLEPERNDLTLRMIRTDVVGESAPAPATERKFASKPKTSRQPATPSSGTGDGGGLPLFNQLSDQTIERIRTDFPGWDIYALKNDFDAWLAENPGRQPNDYQKAFYGFVRQHHQKNRG